MFKWFTSVSHIMSSALFDISAYFENLFKILNYLHSQVISGLKIFGAALKITKVMAFYSKHMLSFKYE